MSDNKFKYILITVGLVALIALGWLEQSDIDRLLDIAEGAFK